MNDGDQALSFVYLVGLLVLVVSALLVRRIPIGQGLKMFAGWVLIFLAALRGEPIEVLAEATSANFYRLCSKAAA